MQTSIVILSCILLLLCGSCRKDREVHNYKGSYTITGKVIDQITGKGIGQALVGVIEKDKNSFYGYAGKTVVSLRTDAEGNFSLTFNANAEDNHYEIVATAAKYFEMTQGGDNISFTKNGKKTQNVSLMPHGYLSLNIKGNKGGNKISLNAGGGPYYSGVDTFVVIKWEPNIKISFGYWVSYFTDSSLNYNSVFNSPPPPPHDTVYHLIEF